MENLYMKSMLIYNLHRSAELDHQKGRPAILLKSLGKESLVWYATTKVNTMTNEKPIELMINKTKTYLYSKGIIKVETTAFKSFWINNLEYKPLILPREHQKFLVQKFISFTNVKDPFKESKELRTQLEATKLNYQAVIEASEKTIQELKEKIKRLEQQAEKEYQIDDQVLSQDKTRI